jgi:hypothetical protein
LRRRKTRTKALELGAAVAAALCLNACGSEGGKGAEPPPTLPRAVASSLAARSDAVADALAAGDSCGAATLATQLQQETIAAINSGRVSGALLEPLSAGVNDLVTRVKCVPPPEPQQDQKGRGEHKGHDKKKPKEGD